MNIGKKLLVSLLAICLIISVLPMSVFAAEDKPYKVGNNTYSDLQTALNAARDGENKTVIVTDNAEVSGAVTIPSGVTLLVPYDATHKAIDPEKDYVTTEATGQNCYVNLTVNGTVTVEGGGVISVGGKFSSS